MPRKGRVIFFDGQGGDPTVRGGAHLRGGAEAGGDILPAHLRTFHGLLVLTSLGVLRSLLEAD
eukprot:530323-Prorocentrum_minimum.AAC.1